MQDAIVLGNSFYAHLMDSMLTLVNSFGEPLRHQANLLTNANAPVDGYSFNGAAMNKYLKNADFKFTSTAPLVISGPTEEMILENYNGFAPDSDSRYPGRQIRINIYRYIFSVQQNVGGFFPQNGTGLANFKTVLGKLVLHEMLHLEGYSHPAQGGVSYDPSLIYYRTFPEVAEQAYFRLRSNTFPPGTVTVFNLTSAEERNCGSNR
ncbi:MAG: hypothetical protein KME45_33070 [Stenomitos rutilans HA7619-LM2]|jgi:hypothetical protein|nr:hypothetical protein [Stenomitos rutilans HA7619-LM2]